VEEQMTINLKIIH